jgi:hypothetical protein
MFNSQFALGLCEEFLHTFPHEDMHSQNLLGVELLCSCILTSYGSSIQCNEFL